MKKVMLLLTALLSVASAIAITGTTSPQFKGIDSVMEKTMKEYDVPGAVVGFFHDGKLSYARGFGTKVKGENRPVEPYSQFRVASLSKLITASAILKLTEDGQLKLDDKVFSILPHQVPAGMSTDPRLYDITVRDLLRHSGGWISSGTNPSPFGLINQIKTKFGITDAPSSAQMVSYGMGLPMQYDPGSQSKYSNYGYVVLSELISHVSGVNFEEYTRSIFRDIDIHRMFVARASYAEQREDEVEYWNPGFSGTSYYEDIPTPTPSPYGGIIVQESGGAGSWTTSLFDLIRLSKAMDNDPSRKDLLSAATQAQIMERPSYVPENRDSWHGLGFAVKTFANGNRLWHHGGIDGTGSFVYSMENGDAFAVIINSRIDFNTGDGNLVDIIEAKLWPEYNKIKDADSWPSHNLFLPQLQTPANNTPNLPLPVTLSWDYHDKAESYRLVVATDAAFNTVVYDNSAITSSSFSLDSELSENTNYFWKVIPNQSGYVQEESEVFSFNTTPLSGNYTISSSIAGATSGGGSHPDYVQKNAGDVPYAAGDKVSFNGACYESLINNNMWSPASYPAGWTSIACGGGTVESNGTITPSGDTTLNWGESHTYMISPNSGYRIKEILVDGSPAATDFSYQFNGINANHSISVEFEEIPAAVTSSYVLIRNRWTAEYIYDGGTTASFAIRTDNHNSHWEIIDVPGESTYKWIKNRATGEFMNIEPNDGFLRVDIDSASDWQSAQWEIKAIDGTYDNIRNRWQSDSYIHEQDYKGYVQHGAVESNWWSKDWEITPISNRTFTITADSDEHSSFVEETSTVINEGLTKRYVVRVDSGYEIVDVTVDGSSVGTSPFYTFGAITKDHTIAVTTRPIEVTGNQVTIIYSAGGTGSGSVTVENGIVTPISATANSGYSFTNWSVESGIAAIADVNLASTTVTVNNSDVTLKAHFSLNQYLLNVTAGANGTVNGSATVNHGEATAVTATAAAGFVFSGWSVLTGSATFADNNSPSTTVTQNSGDAAVQANFIERVSQFSLTITNGTGGGVSPGGTFPVNNGSATAIQAVAFEGYLFSGWTVEAGVALIENNNSLSTTVTLSSSDATVKANFTEVISQYSLSITSGTGGAVSPQGTFPVNKGAATSILAAATEGYVFSGWTVESGAALIENNNSLSTKVTLNSSDATVKANFIVESGTGDVVLLAHGNLSKGKTGFSPVGGDFAADIKAGLSAGDKVYATVDGNQYAVTLAGVSTWWCNISWEEPYQGNGGSNVELSVVKAQ